MARRADVAVPARDLVLGIALYAALIPLLAYVPYWFPHAPAPDGSIAADGYNNRVAYGLVAVFLLTATALFAIASRRGWISAAPAADSPTSSFAGHENPGSRRWDYLIVFVGVWLVYWPWFLAKQGPYVEDNYLLGFLFRLQCGQVPYRDFEYNYSPLSLYIPHAWMQLFGFSLVSYYTLHALGEAVKFTLLLAVLKRYFPSARTHWRYLFLLAPFLVNVLMAWNYNGIRQALPVFIIGMVAARPRHRASAVMAAGVTGLLLAFSHDFGLFALVGVMAIYAFLAWRERTTADMFTAAGFVFLAGTVWLSCSLLTMGAELPHYLQASLERTRAYDAGEWNLPFYWTVDSSARFAFLLLACYLVGRGVLRDRSARVASGDLLLWGGLAYTVVALKGGMHRPDIWHISPPFLVLVFAFVLPWPRMYFASGVLARRFGLALIAVMAFTYLAGQAPTASFVAQGWRVGLRSWISEQRVPEASRVLARRDPLESERMPPRPAVLALAAYLAQPVRSHRPVTYYYRAWRLDKMVGACSAIYPATGDLLSEQMGNDVFRFLQATPDALVVVDKETYERLVGLEDRNRPPDPTAYYEETPTKRILAWLSTVHFRAAETEAVRAEARWARTVGWHLVSSYGLSADFTDWVVLEKKTTNVGR